MQQGGIALKVIKIDLPSDLENIEILFLADLHIGDNLSDWDLITRLIKYAIETPNCYVILGGDLMDSATCSSIGDTYAATIQPMEQLKRCVEIFGPLAPKTLAVVPGNHENRVYKADGIDMTLVMCSQLGIADKYSDTAALIFVRFGANARTGKTKDGKTRKQRYSIYCNHGTAGGRKEGGKLNRLADMAEIVDADLYLTAHSHLPATFKTSYARADAVNSSVQWVTHTFVNTASALQYGGYGERNGYKPASNDYPRIILDERKKNVKVIL